MSKQAPVDRAAQANEHFLNSQSACPPPDPTVGGVPHMLG